MEQLRQLYLAVDLFCYSPFILAADSDKPNVATKSMASSPLTTDALIQTLLGLGAILALIMVLAWLLKRTGRFQSSPNGEIKIIAGVPLGTREKAVLIEVAGERVLVGVTPQQIQTLHVVGQTASQQKTASFDQHLNDVIEKQSI